MTKKEMKILGYYRRLDATDQEIILEIIQKSLRINRSLWSHHCYDLLARLEQLEKVQDNTIDLFNNK